MIIDYPINSLLCVEKLCIDIAPISHKCRNYSLFLHSDSVKSIKAEAEKNYSAIGKISDELIACNTMQLGIMGFIIDIHTIDNSIQQHITTKIN